MNTDLKNLIFEYLKTQKLMSVAVYGAKPWIANLYYVHDKDLNLYFLSKKWREHSKAIDVNHEVAVSIADSHQSIHKPQKGIQLYGTAEQVNIIKQLEWMFKMWNKLITAEGGEKLDNPQRFLEAGTSSIYKIIPKRIKFFNTELWPKDQIRILDL